MAFLKDSAQKAKGPKRETAFKATSFCTLILAGVFILSLWTTGVLGVEESDLKAAFLYQFTRFVEWPDDNRASDELIIGVMADGDILNAIRLLNGRESRKRPIQIKKITEFPHDGRLDVLFIKGCYVADIDNVLKSAMEAHVLTVCDKRDGIDRGFVISLFDEKSRLKFNINLKSARKSSIRISSRLLRLAQKVID